MLTTMVEEYRNARAISDMWDRAYTEDPENEDIERRWDEAYRDYITAMDKLVNEITYITAGKINRMTARAMVVNRIDELEEICRRYER